MDDVVRFQVDGPEAEPGRTAAANAAPFWRHQGLEELIEDQGVGAVIDLESLADTEATAQELSAFLDALR